MLSIEKREEFYIIRNDEKEILERFLKIKPDPDFFGYYWGLSHDFDGSVVLFSNDGEFIYKFSKPEPDLCVLSFLDKIIKSQNIINAMKGVQSRSFWTDPKIVNALREKHISLYKQRQNCWKDKKKADMLFEVEKKSIQRFLLNKTYSNSLVRETNNQSLKICKQNFREDVVVSK